jgi:hypothetical protein
MYSRGRLEGEVWGAESPREYKPANIFIDCESSVKISFIKKLSLAAMRANRCSWKLMITVASPALWSSRFQMFQNPCIPVIEKTYGDHTVVVVVIFVFPEGVLSLKAWDPSILEAIILTALYIYCEYYPSRQEVGTTKPGLLQPSGDITILRWYH